MREAWRLGLVLYSSGVQWGWGEPGFGGDDGGGGKNWNYGSRFLEVMALRLWFQYGISAVGLLTMQRMEREGVGTE